MKTILSACLFAALVLASGSSEATQQRLSRSVVDYELALKGHELRGVAAPVVLASANYSATTTGGPTYTRALSDCSGLSGVGVGVNYHVQEFHVGVSGAHDVSSAQTGSWDGFIFVYENSFNPAAALTNCLAGSDDGVGGIGTSEILCPY